ncbi:unnamed protein product, partial [Polarella glacialis]
DLIVLTSGGGTLGSSIGAEEIGAGQHVFFFPRGSLEPEAEIVADRLDPDSPRLSSIGFGGGEDDDDLLGQRCEDVIDPAFEAFRSNIAEARKRIAESRPVAALAMRAEERLGVQRLAARAVLDNLTSHRATCSRSMSLLTQKYGRIQGKFDENLQKVEASMAALSTVLLHPALSTPGRQSLADVVPRDRILRFTAGLEDERARLSQRLEKLQRQDTQLRLICDQVSEKVRQLLEEDSVGVEARAIQQKQVHVQRDLLPELRALVPSAGAAPSSVLEDEKQSALMLESLANVCAEVRSSVSQLQGCWDCQHQSFVQRLREVSCVQSKVRYLERQAALLEEEVNAQSGYSQQLSRLQKMPKAYERALKEVARRRHFRVRYAAQCEQARSTMARMVEEENSRRRSFLLRYSCYLPADLVQGLGSLAPPAVVELPDFDALLPDIDFSSLMEVSASASGGREQPVDLTSSAGSSSQQALAALSGSASPPPGGSAKANSRRRSAEKAEATEAEDEESGEDRSRIEELEARNRALEEQLAAMMAKAQKEDRQEENAGDAEAPS